MTTKTRHSRWYAGIIFSVALISVFLIPATINADLISHVDYAMTNYSTSTPISTSSGSLHVQVSYAVYAWEFR